MIITHLVEEGEVAFAAGLVAELGHANRLAVGLLDGEAQDVSAMTHVLSCLTENHMIKYSNQQIITDFIRKWILIRLCIVMYLTGWSIKSWTTSC